MTLLTWCTNKTVRTIGSCCNSYWFGFMFIIIMIIYLWLMCNNLYTITFFPFIIVSFLLMSIWCILFALNSFLNFLCIVCIVCVTNISLFRKWRFKRRTNEQETLWLNEWWAPRLVWSEIEHWCRNSPVARDDSERVGFSGFVWGFLFVCFYSLSQREKSMLRKMYCTCVRVCVARCAYR